jgi:cullin-4
LKTSQSTGNLGRSADMSKTLGLGSRPKVIDLTRPPSNFQPHAGAKRLVIKNLRPTSTKSVDEYYGRTWSELDAALTSVFNKRPPSTPLGVLCRGVEATCRRGQAEKLFLHLKDRCKGYLEKQLLPELEKQSGTSNVDALRAVQRFWVAWNEQSV